VDPAGDTEMLGMVLLEAMRYGRPVVCTRVGGTVDIVRDGVNGLLAPEKDPAALADAVGRLLDDDGLAARLGEAGLATARDDFGWPAIVGRVKSLYQMP
jgi:glycosyltransferase involved in cell wall biosynthesis